MKNSKVLFQDFINRITINESKDEIESIAYLVFEKIVGLTKTEIFSNTDIQISEADLSELIQANERINKNEPVQYVLGEAFFYGRRFQVTPAVLIPRPETEELVAHIIQNIKKKEPRILDIGTGSGCIPITIALEIKDAVVYATDVSEQALSVAKQNASFLEAKIDFAHHDILKSRIPFDSLDVIVSNPPYITQKESSKMSPNVTQHEPHLALFVPDSDPLVFYKAIAEKARQVLNNNGLLIVEINAQYGEEISRLFSENGYQNVSTLKDANGKDRIVSGIL
jgi:release factor glutamine methyltransferase